MKLLITAGPTREPIDPVRFISNHSSGQLGASLVQAAISAGHEVTAIFGPVPLQVPSGARRMDVQTSRQMHEAVRSEFPKHDLLIMAAAVADYRPKTVSETKIGRGGTLTIELEATEDIVASAADMRRPDQRVVGFSLEAETGLDRAKAKLARKHLDMMVFNPLQTMNSGTIQSTLLYPDGRSESLPELPKTIFAEILIQRCIALTAG